MARTKKQSIHYVDNKQFLAAMIDYKQACKQCEEQGQESPPLPDYIGECFMKIAERLSFRPNFVNYAFREEMIADGIENCLQYCSNFDPEASKNPFSYFTQIIYYAFVRRIEKEKKQSYIKSKLAIKMMDEKRLAEFSEQDDDFAKQHLETLIQTDPENIVNFERQLEKRKQGRKKYKKNLERFMS